MHSRIELYYWLSKAREGLVLVCSIITVTQLFLLLPLYEVLRAGFSLIIHFNWFILSSVHCTLFSIFQKRFRFRFRFSAFACCYIQTEYVHTYIHTYIVVSVDPFASDQPRTVPVYPLPLIPPPLPTWSPRYWMLSKRFAP